MPSQRAQGRAGITQDCAIGTNKIDRIGQRSCSATAEQAICSEVCLMPRSKRKVPPIHPGEILVEDLMKPLGLTMNRLALDLHVPVTRIADIVHRKRGITVDSAYRLARYFGTTVEFWMNLQRDYELQVAEHEKFGEKIQREVRPLERAAAG
jgi:addiction module HigA family antidote